MLYQLETKNKTRIFFKTISALYKYAEENNIEMGIKLNTLYKKNVPDSEVTNIAQLLYKNDYIKIYVFDF
jgi:RNase H-fold protein (predicted Holliday junction resolvase)